MSIIIGWRIWYTEGRVYDSQMTTWEKLPDDGVLCICYYFSDTTPAGLPLRRVDSGADYYFKAGDVYGSNNDPPEIILARYPDANIKRGKWTTLDEMNSAEQEMMRANTWPL